jgi:hypothetical protein
VKSHPSDHPHQTQRRTRTNDGSLPIKFVSGAARPTGSCHDVCKARSPADAVDWNQEERRNTGMGPGDLKGWFLDLPIRRDCPRLSASCVQLPAASSARSMPRQ